MAMHTEHQSASSRRNGKSATAFRTISEVADDLEVPPHVLRFWETKFSQVRPLKRGGGRRYYRPEDVALLRRIRTLLYQDGYTIKGVQKLLKDGAGRPAPAVAESGFDPELPGLTVRGQSEDPPAPRQRQRDAAPAESSADGQRDLESGALGELRAALVELQALKATLDKARG